MILVDVQTQKDQANFAQEAAEFFKENPKCFTYTRGDLAPGELLAIRWNCMAVVVVRISEDSQVLNYPVHQFLGGDLPRLIPVSHQ